MSIESHSGPGFPEQRCDEVPAASVVLCDSDGEVAKPLLLAVEQHGMKATWCPDGASALLEVGALAPAAFVIAEHIDGSVAAAEVVAAVREHTDVLVLVGANPDDPATARRALGWGGSAVISRPYDASAVIAFAGIGAGRRSASKLAAEPLIVNPLNHEVRVRGEDIVLTKRELDVLVYLMGQRGRVASTEEISETVWGHPTRTNTVAVHIKRLRAKLGADAHGPLIRTVRGAGYRLAPHVYD